MYYILLRVYNIIYWLIFKLFFYRSILISNFAILYVYNWHEINSIIIIIIINDLEQGINLGFPSDNTMIYCVVVPYLHIAPSKVSFYPEPL